MGGKWDRGAIRQDYKGGRAATKKSPKANPNGSGETCLGKMGVGEKGTAGVPEIAGHQNRGSQIEGHDMKGNGIITLQNEM